MPQDKQFRVSVDDTKIKNLQASAEDLARGMIRSSRQYSTSSKEVLRDLEDQIKAIERRNKLDDQFNRQKIEASFQSGRTAQPQYQQQLQGQMQSSNEDRLQVQLLREVIKAIEDTSKKEIREDRKAVEARINESKRKESLSPSGNAEDILRETIQYGLIGETTESERNQRTTFRDRGVQFGQGANRAIGTAAGAQNEFYVAAAALALIPFIGQGMSQFGNRLLGGANRYETGLSNLSKTGGLNQTSSKNIIQGYGDLSEMGLTPAEAAEKLGAFRGASGNRVGFGRAFQMMQAGQALGIDDSMIGQLSGILRYSTNTGREKYIERSFESNKSGLLKEAIDSITPKGDVFKDRTTLETEAEMKMQIQNPELYKALNKNRQSGVGEGTDAGVLESTDVVKSRKTTTGIMEAISIFDRSSKGNTSILKEMLGTFNSTSQQILQISGGIDMESTAAGIAGIGSATGTSGMQLGRVVSGVQGLGKSQNPIVRSMMLKAFRQSMPDASFFDIRAAMETPMKHLDVVQSALGGLKDMTGGGELYKQGLHSFLGGQLSLTDIKQIEEGGDITKIFSEAEKFKGKGVTDFGGRLDDVVGVLDKSTAKIDAFMQDKGESMVKFLDESMEAIKAGVSSLFDTEGQGNLKNSVKDGVREGVMEVRMTSPYQQP